MSVFAIYRVVRYEHCNDHDILYHILTTFQSSTTTCSTSIRIGIHTGEVIAEVLEGTEVADKDNTGSSSSDIIIIHVG